MIGVPASFGTFALLLVAVRVVDRTVLRNYTLGWDDYLVIVAAVSTLAINHGIRSLTRNCSYARRFSTTYAFLVGPSLADGVLWLSDIFSVTRHGMGSDLWTIPFPSINTTLKVSHVLPPTRNIF